MFGDTNLGLFPQQRPQSAAQDEGDTVVGQRGVNCCLRRLAVGRQLHQ